MQKKTNKEENSISKKEKHEKRSDFIKLTSEICH